MKASVNKVLYLLYKGGNLSVIRSNKAATVSSCADNGGHLTFDVRVGDVRVCISPPPKWIGRDKEICRHPPAKLIKQMARDDLLEVIGRTTGKYTAITVLYYGLTDTGKAQIEAKLAQKRKALK